MTAPDEVLSFFNYILIKTILQYRIACGNIYPTKQNIHGKENKK